MNFLLYILLTSSVLNMPVDYTLISKNLSSNETIIEELSNNEILVTLSEEESKKWIEYSPGDFAEVNCVLIEDLTASFHPNSNSLVTSDELESFNRILKLEVDDEINNEMLGLLENRNDILAAEPNYELELIYEPQEEASSYTTMALDEEDDRFWGQKKIHLDSAHSFLKTYVPAWEYSQAKVLIPELDINEDHHSFNFSNIEVYSEDVLSSSGILDISHGTSVAGILVGKSFSISDTDYEYSSFNPNMEATIYRYDFHVSGGAGGQPQLVNASQISEIFTYAANNNFDIVNCSFSFKASELPDSDDENDYFTSIYTSIRNFPGLVICGSGNGNVDLGTNSYNADLNPVYPAGFDLDNIISVGAIDENEEPMETNDGMTSYFGATSVDVFAPGQNIYVPIYREYGLDWIFGYENGTSFAAPFVTGIASLIYSLNQDDDCRSIYPSKVKEIIMSTVTQTSSLQGKCVSGGYINAYDAIEAAYYEFIVSIDRYEYYNDTHHSVVMTYGPSHLEEHDWIPYFPSKAINLPLYFICSKCGAQKMN